MKDWQNRLKEVVVGRILLNESLAKYSTMRVGGPADVVFFPKDEKDLLAGLRVIFENKVKFITLGKGSNTLIKDGGFRGVVVIFGNEWHNYSIEKETDEYVFVKISSGTTTEDFVNVCIENGWYGFEGLSGIPGTIGGNVCMNAGTKYGVIGDALIEVYGIDKNLEEKIIKRDELELGYRKIKLPKPFVVTKVLLMLKKGNKEEIAARITDYIEKRREIQPDDLPSLGSIFKRPAKGYAGQLIEEAGLKGVRVGGARISEKHAGFIVNENNATARDVMVLIGLIRDKVKQNSGINLETEIIIVGDEND